MSYSSELPCIFLFALYCILHYSNVYVVFRFILDTVFLICLGKIKIFEKSGNKIRNYWFFLNCRNET